jgi:hypothetical protein
MTMAAILPGSRPAAFRYTLPPESVAGAAVDIGHVAVTIGLLLAGELDVLTGPAPTDVHRVGAEAAVGAVAKGLMIRGLGSATPSVSAASGHVFTQRHHDFRAPDTVTFSGDCVVGFTHRHDGMTVTVSGELRYSLEVTARRPPSATAPRGWFRRHEKELASIGMVLLVAVPVDAARLSLHSRP